MTCPGSHLKQAAGTELSICARETARPHLAVSCRLSAWWQGGLVCVTCACGLAFILQPGAGAMEPLSLSMSSTETKNAVMRLLRNANLRGLYLPQPRSLVARDSLTTEEQLDDLMNLQAAMVSCLSRQGNTLYGRTAAEKYEQGAFK
jgi:hypothetical protein